MPTDIVIPEIADSVHSGVIAAWLKSEGDHVDRDEPILELETDKITLEIPSPAAGTIRHRASVGDEVDVGAIVGVIDESANGTPAKAKSAPAEKPKDAPKSAESSGAPSKAAPAKEEAPAKVETAHDDVRITPLARKLAEEKGVDLSSITGTGAGGRIREQDVLAVIERGASSKGAPAAPTSTSKGVQRGVRHERMSPLRQRIAARLVEAQQTAAMLTTFNECDMTEVMRLRKLYKEGFQERHGIGLGFMSFFVKATVQALSRFPAVNASMVQHEGHPAVEYHDYADIAMAVSTPKGLSVPVLRNCESLSFAQIEAGVKDLAVRARDGKLGLDDLQGGTFTITNGGIFGSLMSTPILNPPQTGILGMHTIKNRAVEDPTKPGQVAIRPMMYLALSYDHRVLDGAGAVQFLVAIKDAIENPERLLLDV